MTTLAQRPAGVALRRGRWSALTLVYLAVAGVVAYLVLAPLALLIVSALKPNEALPTEPGALSLDNVRAVYGDPATWRLLANTAVFAVGALLVGLTIAAVLAWLVECTNLPLKGFVYATILIPIALPGILEALAWILLLDPRIGLVNTILRGAFGSHAQTGPFSAYTLYAMVLVQGLRIVPPAFLMMAGTFRNMDASLEEASRASGRGAGATFRRVTVPLMRPALIAALIYFFITCIESFEVPGVLGLSAGVFVFSSRIYYASNPATGLPQYGTASTLAAFVLILAFVMLAAYQRATHKARRYATISGKGHRVRAVDLRRWRWPAFMGYLVYLCLAVVLPLFILVWASFQSFYAPPSIGALRHLSLSAYRAVFGQHDFTVAVVHTALLAVVTATATVALAGIVAWFATRSRQPGRRALDTLAFLPHSVPSLIVGYTVLFVYLAFPNPLYGTVWIIAVALATKYLAFGSRAMNAAYLQVDRELDEAAAVAGRSAIATFRRVLLPLVAPVVLNVWLWMAMSASRELSAALVLGTPNNAVLSTLVWQQYRNGDLAEASVVAIMLIIPTVLLTLLARRFVVRFVR
jgi:iron(III) transport system permease protein